MSKRCLQRIIWLADFGTFIHQFIPFMSGKSDKRPTRLHEVWSIRLSFKPITLCSSCLLRWEPPITVLCKQRRSPQNFLFNLSFIQKNVSGIYFHANNQLQKLQMWGRKQIEGWHLWIWTSSRRDIHPHWLGVGKVVGCLSGCPKPCDSVSAIWDFVSSGWFIRFCQQQMSF